MKKNINSSRKCDEKLNLRKFHETCLDGNVKSFKQYLRQNINVEELDKYGKNAMHYACQGSCLKIVSYLSKIIVDIDKPDKDGDTPLYLACYYGRAETVNFLLRSNRVDFRKIYRKIYGMSRIICVFVKNKMVDDVKDLVYRSCVQNHSNIIDSIIFNNYDFDFQQKFSNKGTMMTLYEIGHKNGHYEIMESLFPFQSLNSVKKARLNYSYHKRTNDLVIKHFYKIMSEIIYILKTSRNLSTSLWSTLPTEILEQILSDVCEKYFRFGSK